MGMFGSRPSGYPVLPAPVLKSVEALEVSPLAAALMPGATDPCVLCGMAREALLRLMGGSTTQRVAFGGHKGHREVTYSAGNAKELRAEVRRLEQECELSRGLGRARQAGPPTIPNGMFGLGRFNPFGPRRY